MKIFYNFSKCFIFFLYISIKSFQNISKSLIISQNNSKSFMIFKIFKNFSKYLQIFNYFSHSFVNFFKFYLNFPQRFPIFLNFLNFSNFLASPLLAPAKRNPSACLEEMASHIFKKFFKSSSFFQGALPPAPPLLRRAFSPAEGYSSCGGL